MKVLIADDDRISLLKLSSMLQKWDYEVITSENGVDAWQKIIQEESPKLLILDWMMPGLDGPSVCRKIRSLKSDTYYYILLLTSRNEKEDIIKGMEAGADDYITKPFSPHELKVRLRAGQRIVQLNKELLEARNALQEQATHDSLTGLLNRRAILDQLNLELARRKRSGEKMCLSIMDIDNFKHVNDTYGHNVGDQVLQETARRLIAALRPYDSVGRYGGEEFLIIMSECTCEIAAAGYERLRKSLADKAIVTEKGPIPVTASFGVSLAPSAEDFDAETLIAIADKALYRAKDNGRNRVEVEHIDSK